jgi:hypothetical protein
VEAVRVDVAYRPLRIGWAIRAGDMDAFRAAVRISFALWGGRFNPIIAVDQIEQAKQLISTFRVDLILPLGDSEPVKQFPKKFPHLITPFFHDGVFLANGQGVGQSQVLDVYNALVDIDDKAKWKNLKDKGLRLYSWMPDDALADIFRMHLGEYPSVDEVHLDYRSDLKRVSEAKEVAIESWSQLPADLFDYPSISSISRFGIEPHYSVGRAGWSTPGFFSGNASNFDDLLCFWNLRAADIPALFVDSKHLERYGETIGVWGERMREVVSHRRNEFERRLAVWVREQSLDADMAKAMVEVKKPFGGLVSEICVIRRGELNVRPPMMLLGEASTLGVMSVESAKRRISFSLDNKPFCDHPWFHTQQLVASLSFIGGLHGDEDYTLVPPFVPELNEFYARAMHFEYDKLRSESDRIGIVINACDKTSFIDALPVLDLIEKIFDLAGFSAQLSAGGLIARQLIAQFGGVDGARAFKIPGVRRLLKTHGPRAAFTKKSAIELIGSKDPDNPTASFKDYENLYIEPRPPRTKLEPAAVFSYLVQKGLFRMGAELTCPHCHLNSWTALDVLKQRLVCEMCGREFDATRQLVDGKWHYRRSGVLGTERNAQGAIPVVLTLQQLKVNMSTFQTGMYSPSLDLSPKEGRDLLKCEVDFVWLIPAPYVERTMVVIGECKDQGDQNEDGEKKGTIDAKDVDHLRRVADALPRSRFYTYIVLAKLCPFTHEEIALAKTLNGKYERRVIMLTARELEPYHLYERAQREFNKINPHGSDPEDWANNTAIMYFGE